MGTDADPAQARARALRFLGHQDRSCREVEVRLERYGYAEPVIAEVVKWLQGLGYLDDVRYAQAFTEEKLRAGWGPVRIRQALLREGVVPDVVAEQLRGGGEALALVEMVRRRFGALAEQDPRAARRKAEGFLARNGHEWDVIRQVVQSALGARVENGRDAGET